MKSRFANCKQILFVATFFLMFNNQFALAQDKIESWGNACAKVLQPDELTINFGNDTSSAFRDAMCNSKSTSYQANGGLDIIEVLSFEGGYKEVTKEDFCKDTTLIVRSQTIWQFWSKTTNDKAREEFSYCMAQFPKESGSLSALASTFSNTANDGIVITTRWDRNVLGDQPIFNNIQTQNIVCNTPPVWQDNKINSEPKNILCKWSNSYSTTGFVIIDTKNRGSDVVQAVRTISALGKAQLKITKYEDKITGKTTISGPVIPLTANFHQFKCVSSNYPAVCIGDWQGIAYPMSVPLPDNIPASDLLAIIDSRRENCNDSGNGSAGWNVCGAKDRLVVVEASTKVITVHRIFGSKPLTDQLIVDIPVHTKNKITSDGGFYTLPKEINGYVFEVRIPTETEGTLEIKWANGNTDSLPLGTSNSKLKLETETQTSSYKTYKYRVIWQIEGFIDHKLYK